MAVEIYELILPISVDINPYADVDKDMWFAQYLKAAKTANLIRNSIASQYFYPTGYIKRGDISDIIYRIMAIKELGEEKFEPRLEDLLVD